MSQRFWVWGFLALLLAAAVLVAWTRASSAAHAGYDIESSPDFTLEVQPAAQAVVQGQSITYTTTLTAQEGFSETVQLAVGGIPADTRRTSPPTRSPPRASPRSWSPPPPPPPSATTR